jgi:hypothetical protein
MSKDHNVLLFGVRQSKERCRITDSNFPWNVDPENERNISLRIVAKYFPEVKS